MVRRGLLALIVPCLLLSQTATVVAHIHCRDSVGADRALPHFHWPSWLGGASNPHRHGPCTSAMTDQADDASREISAASASLPIATCAGEHDADAVYIGRIPLVAQKRGSFDRGDDDGSLSGLLPLPVSQPDPNLSPCERPHLARNIPPDPLPIYLHHHRFLL